MKKIIKILFFVITIFSLLLFFKLLYTYILSSMIFSSLKCNTNIKNCINLCCKLPNECKDIILFLKNYSNTQSLTYFPYKDFNTYNEYNFKFLNSGYVKLNNNIILNPSEYCVDNNFIQIYYTFNIIDEIDSYKLLLTIFSAIFLIFTIIIILKQNYYNHGFELAYISSLLIKYIYMVIITLLSNNEINEINDIVIKILGYIYLISTYYTHIWLIINCINNIFIINKYKYIIFKIGLFVSIIILYIIIILNERYNIHNRNIGTDIFTFISNVNLNNYEPNKLIYIYLFIPIILCITIDLVIYCIPFIVLCLKFNYINKIIYSDIKYIHNSYKLFSFIGLSCMFELLFFKNNNTLISHIFAIPICLQGFVILYIYINIDIKQKKNNFNPALFFV